ncbi:complement resistance protein TraT [Enterovibrio paralichthyis]|uniref:complement resistance protein TraT n=1 Tax=Enterovibrio paralichthyis TaxID=2853805 RepID=UPI001C46B634|nr:complement resistance protein TraT [Enterovibrio paralichthyis]MBV7300225.1 complement resistance protein TraT [Enterovibrio paralichthyis]
MKTKTTLLGMALASTLVLSGCGAVHTAVAKRNLEVKTQTSETIWLQPDMMGPKTIFIQTKDTSGTDFDLAVTLKQVLTSNGFQVTQDPNAAHYWLQSNTIKLEKMEPHDINQFLSGGYGAGIAGASFGGAALALATDSPGYGVGGSLIGGLVAVAADAMVEDVTYGLVTDIQLSVKSDKALLANETQKLQQGASSTITVNSTEKTDRMRYQTRIVASANQVNLTLEEAKPALSEAVVKSIYGIL